MTPSSTWSTGTLARWVRVSSLHRSRHTSPEWNRKHTCSFAEHSEQKKKGKLQANLFTHGEVLSLFILMKSHFDGIAFSHTLLLSIFSSHYTAYPLSIQYQTFIMWRCDAVIAVPARRARSTDTGTLSWLPSWHFYFTNNRWARWVTVQHPCSRCIRSMPMKTTGSWLWTCAAEMTATPSETSRWRTSAKAQERKWTR